uniref:uncharacterized protein LOC132693151 n=1 Tax=Panthera onca TaxID=9690 RepID=UPI002953BC89|nr:uncharacterized protein LOC132693151 [Panthera onca]
MAGEGDRQHSRIAQAASGVSFVPSSIGALATPRGRAPVADESPHERDWRRLEFVFPKLRRRPDHRVRVTGVLSETCEHMPPDAPLSRDPELRRASPAYASPNHGQDADQSEGLSVAAWTPPQCPPPGEWRGQLWKVLGQAHPHSPAPGRGDLDAVAARDENPAVSLPGQAPGRRRLPRRRPPASCSPVAPRALERGASQENSCPLDISPAGEDTEAQSSSAICQTSHTQCPVFVSWEHRRGLEEQTFILSRSGGWEFKTTAWAGHREPHCLVCLKSADFTKRDQTLGNDSCPRPTLLSPPLRPPTPSPCWPPAQLRGMSTAEGPVLQRG